jgi:predicted RNase H-like HicB family nuclease
MLTYTVELKPQKEGGYTVTAPALPGCISEGDTAEEALKNIRDAVEGYIKASVKHGRKVPLEFSDIRQIDVFKHPIRQKLKSNSCYA